MELPKGRIPATRKNPRILTLFGQSKVGKTSTLALLEDCLIVDTEKGSELVDAMRTTVNNLKDLSELYKELIRAKKEDEFTYKYIAIDTIDNLVGWIERSVCKREQVNDLIDIPYGAGYNEVRNTTLLWIKRMLNVTPHVIIIGHRKKTITDTESTTVSVSSLELSGKLKNQIMADSDACGYVFRTSPPKLEEGETAQETAFRSEIMVSFVANDELEAGARQEHLKGKIIPFKWDNIYIE